jgi:hypothetical protein
MGLSDKFKNLAKQAQDAVAEHSDKLHGAVESVGVAVNEKTQGKYASHIAKVGEKTSSAIDKIGGTTQADQASEAASADTADTSGEPAASGTAASHAEPSAAGAEPDSPDSEPTPFTSPRSSPERAAPSEQAAPPAGEGFPSFDE